MEPGKRLRSKSQVAELGASLTAVVGPNDCFYDPERCASYETDWTRRWHGAAALVVRPHSTSEVSEIARLCAQHGFPIVPQGGNTGLVGGGVPRGGEVLLSTSNLNLEISADFQARQLRAGAGVTLAQAQAVAAAQGCTLGIDLASRDTATLGGMAATNAGGIHVIRYGPMRARLVGMEAVLADGSVIDRLAGLVKDNVGYDLAGLLTGSEGTLGVITKVVVRLDTVPPEKVAVMLALNPLPGPGGAVASALRVLTDLRQSVDGVEAAELLLPVGLALVYAHSGLPPLPGSDPGSYLLVEVAGTQSPLDRLAAAIQDHPLVQTASVAADNLDRQRLWAYRDRQTEAIATLGVVQKFDVSVPVGRLAGFWAELTAQVEQVTPRARLIGFGHLSEGNLHVNIAPPDNIDPALDRAVVELVLAHGGSISAEHGLGVAKSEFLLAARGEVDVAAMRAIKQALDPRGMMNPGVIFPIPA